MLELDLGLEPRDPGGLRAYYNQQDATRFLSFDGERWQFASPFPDSDDSFHLRVTAAQSAEPLIDGRYRADAGVLVAVSSESTDPATSDRGVANVEWSGQLDLSAQRLADEGSEYESPETEQQRESDLLAGLGVQRAWSRWQASADLELVHRSRRDNTLRLDGPKADLSRMVTALVYGPEGGSRLAFSAGDIDLNSSNDLVNSGMSSRGVSLSFSSPDERLRLDLGQLYGHDIVGLDEGLFGVDSGSHRLSANAVLQLVSSDSFDWELHASSLDVDRGIEDEYGLAASQSGEINRVRGLGSNFSLWADKVELSLSWADSAYDNPSEQNRDNLPAGDDLVVYDPGETRGSAHRHRLLWRAVESERGELSFEYSQEQASAFFRSVQGQSTADRRQWSLISQLAVGRVYATLGSTHYRNNLDDLISIHTLDEAVHSVEVEVDLTPEEGGDSATASPWRPTSLALRSSREALKTLNGEDIILAPVIEGFDFMNQHSTSHGLSLLWEGPGSSTGLDVDYNFFDNSQRERAQADTRDWTYGLSHARDFGRWSVSGRVGLSSNDDLDSASRSRTELREWGLSVAYSTGDGLGFSVALDQSDNDFRDRVLGEDEVDQSRTLGLTVELSKWLAGKLGERHVPTLTSSWSRTESDSRSDYYNSDQRSDAWLINLGVQF